MKCANCGAQCVATYTHSQVIGQRKLTWAECHICKGVRVEKQDVRAQEAIQIAEEAGA
jgi:hypothetical protein